MDTFEQLQTPKALSSFEHESYRQWTTTYTKTIKKAMKIALTTKNANTLHHMRTV